MNIPWLLDGIILTSMSFFYLFLYLHSFCLEGLSHTELIPHTELLSMQASVTPLWLTTPALTLGLQTTTPNVLGVRIPIYGGITF